jgi:PhoH-like ATPase
MRVVTEPSNHPSKQPPPHPAATTRRTYVVDTSVLLADPGALGRFDEHEVVLPLAVISELEAKRHHPDLGWAARRAIRHLEDIRRAHGRLDEAVPVNRQGGTVRVELNHQAPHILPEALRDHTNDHRILSVARALTLEGSDCTLVTKDLPLRLKAAAIGIAAEEYRNELDRSAEWTGSVTVDDVAPALIDALYDDDPVPAEAIAHELLTHTAVVARAGSQSVIARVMPDQTLRRVQPQNAFGLRGRSAEQQIALDLLLDDEIGVVSLGGRAGCGKTVLALAAALELTVEQELFQRVLVFRPLFAVGGQELGYLPGSESEKMSPWAAGVTDALAAFCEPSTIDHLLGERVLEVLPLTHIRGRTFTNSIVIIEEAQNLERNHLLSTISRVGSGSRVFLTHDVAQRDNLRVGRDDGIAAIVSRLKGHPLFAHVTLSRSERSAIAEIAGELLDEA